MNYKKSLLSLVAIMALSNSIMADSSATYLPLSSTTTDSVWSLFGVNGFSDGTPSTTTASSNFTSGYTSLEDDPASDDLATSGLNDGTGDLASVQALNGTSPSITELIIGVDITTAPAPVYDETEPVRTMYFTVNETNSNPNVKLDYKASLEGKAIEISLNGTMYNSTISQTATYDNPASVSAGNVGSGSTTSADRTAIADVLDFDFSDNPVDPANFDYTVHLTTTGQTATFYYFNAATQQWEIWNKNSATAAQDFSEFELGKAYWGRVDVSDTLGALAKDTDGAVGLVLGDDSATSVPDEDRYVDSNVTRLVEGWNMLAFDDVQPYVRHAATGLVLGNVISGDEVFVITDASGVNSITLSAFTDGNSEVDCTAANKEIESAKLRGLLPRTFNVKFFRGATDGTIVVLSDEKFGINETAGTAAITVGTLTAANPYLDGGRSAAITDLHTQVAGASISSYVSSAYGEYTVIAKVNTEDAIDGGATGANHTSADSAGTSTGGLAAISYEEVGLTSETIDITVAGTTTLAQFTGTQLPLLTATSATTDPVGTIIDADFSGTVVGDLVIIANTKPFSLQDKTYTRVFNYTAATGSVNAVVSGAVTPIALLAGDSLAGAATKIDNGGAGIADLYADETSDNKLVTVYPTLSTFDIKDVADGTLDILESSSSSDVRAEGAISDVYRVDTIARKALNQVTDTVTAFTADSVANSILDNAADDWSVNINAAGAVTRAASGATGLGAAAGSVNLISTYGELETMYDEMVTAINYECNGAGVPANAMHCSASHDFAIPTGSTSATALTAAATYTDGTITLTGVDVVNLVIAIVDGDASASETQPTHGAEAGDNLLAFGNGDLVADLKTNPVYSPNFATYGPLYTMRKAGFDVKAMLKATTELDATTGAIAWDSLDVTRAEDEWFDNNEYNLFNINTNSGYWVYLETAVSDTVAITAASITSPGYTYYFSNDSTSTPAYQTENILSSGQISVTVTNLDDAVAGSAYVTIKGEKVQLTRSGTTDTFTGNMSNYALNALAQDQSGPISISIRAVNGKGEAVEDTTTLSFDYQAPDNMAASISGGINIALSADKNATKFYVFEDYIPEVQTTRDALTTTEEVNATNSAASFNACAEYDFDSVTTLRIVAADGDINSANLSEADEIKYASVIKSANVLSHTQGGGTDKTQLGTTYTSNCDANVTQTDPSDNAGVSLKTITTGKTYRISFQPIANANFTTDVAWTSNYEVTNGDGAAIEIQNTPQYAGNTFYIEDVAGTTIYTGTFPATENAADTSISGAANAPIDFGAFTGENTTLVP